MGLPIEAFPASHLLPPHNKLQTTTSGRRRKGPDIDLSQCQLREFTHYACDVRQNSTGKLADRIVCKEIVRFFRRCEGDLMVETTALEPVGGK